MSTQSVESIIEEYSVVGSFLFSGGKTMLKQIFLLLCLIHQENRRIIHTTDYLSGVKVHDTKECLKFLDDEYSKIIKMEE